VTGAGEMLQLRFYFGERDRCGDGQLDAAAMAACARHGVTAAALLRAVEGFGVKQRMRTDRMLTLSEDPPLVAVAVGDRAVIEGLADELRGLASDGLLTLNRVTTLDRVRSKGRIAPKSANSPAAGGGSAAEGPNAPAGRSAPAGRGAGEGPSAPECRGAAGRPRAPEGQGAAEDEIRVTIWGPRTGPRSPHRSAVDALHRHGAEAAMVLLGVDGVLDGERRRARFVASNHEVPAMTVAAGERGRIEAALAEVDGVAPLVTVEGVELYRRMGPVSLHADAGVEPKWPIEPPSLHGDAATRVTYLTSEIEARGPHPCYLELIHSLREQGAAGATALRGVWGFRGATPPHGDRVLALRRDVPILVEAIDAPEPAERWREFARSFVGADDVVHSQPIERTILAVE
jgi:PII-like signaling protein